MRIALLSVVGCALLSYGDAFAPQHVFSPRLHVQGSSCNSHARARISPLHLSGCLCGCASSSIYGLRLQNKPNFGRAHSFQTSGLRMSTPSIVEPSKDEVKSHFPQAKIPISLLSGFLGAGKTTMLKDVLENKGGVRIGLVVNDVAAVNIDSKLIKQGGSSESRTGLIGGQLVDASDVMELQNGCACCSASDELLESVLKLLVVSAQKGESYDRIVIEMSGVAEPKNVRKTFFENKFANHPVFDFCDLQNMVTVVDSANFLPLYESCADINDREDLKDPGLDSKSNRKVVDLLTEQVEVADYVILNKQDLVSPKDTVKLQAIVKSLNPGASVVTSTMGKVDLDVVLGSSKTKWVANNDDEDDFRVALKAAKADQCTDADCKDPSHAHTHSHSEECADAECKDPSHAHSHAHAHEAECADTNCKDPSHDHSHSHSHEAECADTNCKDASHSHSHTVAKEEECTDAKCKDASHSHSHSHEHEHENECADTSCNHPSHAHGHAHTHAAASTPEEKFGISSFVYTRRRPMNAKRLKNVIMQLPVTANSEAASKGGEWEIPKGNADGKKSGSPMSRVIRSKGFVWLTNYHRVALYWSHAGQFFDLKEFGMFWAATPLDYWPPSPAEMQQIVEDFGPAGTLWGDRRQEIVFIGVDMDREAIEKLLDTCLATDEELTQYQIDAEREIPDRVEIDRSANPPRPVPAGFTAALR